MAHHGKEFGLRLVCFFRALTRRFGIDTCLTLLLEQSLTLGFDSTKRSVRAACDIFEARDQYDRESARAPLSR